MSHSVVKLESISKHYDDVLAVDDVSLTVEQGDILVLLGSSGCGKTTTLRLIAGLERPDDGRILLNQRSVADATTWIPPEARQIGMVFQDYALFPHLTVGQNIAFPLKSVKKRGTQARIHELLDLVGMHGLADRFPHQLSGGQQQRVALARALAPHPSVILLDEPFSNLDAFRRKQVREEVRQILKQSGATGIFVTHDQEEAMSIADVIAIMQAGQLLQIGSPSDLYQQPQQPDVANFLGDANWLSGNANGDNVQTALGRLPLVRPMQGDVQVMIRPEALSIEPSREGTAEIAALHFRGYFQEVMLTLTDGTSVQARAWGQEQVAVGDVVRVAVDGTVVAFSLE